MTFIIDGTAGETFPDSSVQATSALVAGKTPYAAMPAGSVLQVVQYSYSTGTTTTTSSWVATPLAGSITPKFTTSKILVCFSALTYTGSSATAGLATVFRGDATGTNLATANANNYGFGGTYVGSNIGVQAVVSGMVLDSPSTTSSQLYTVAIRSESGNTVSIFANNTKGTLTLLEIAG